MISDKNYQKYSKKNRGSNDIKEGNTILDTPGSEFSILVVLLLPTARYYKWVESPSKGADKAVKQAKILLVFFG